MGNSIRCMGFGGLGDAFICALKCLEYPLPYVYTHVDNNQKRLDLSIEVFDKLGIPNGDHIVVKDIRGWWKENWYKYDIRFNVFAKGYIDIPFRDYHWEPCRDNGYRRSFAPNYVTKLAKIAVQVGAGGGKDGPRHYSRSPIVEYVEKTFDLNNVRWFGVDDGFIASGGENYSGKTTLSEAMNLIAECSTFIGFNGLFLYWALYNDLTCHLFMDHQGYDDLRIHDDWRERIVKYIGETKII